MGASVEQVGTDYVLVVEHEGSVTRRSFSNKAKAEEVKKAIQNAESLIKQIDDLEILYGGEFDLGWMNMSETREKP